MKPDALICNNCGIQIARGKWCSDACRKAYSRNPDKKSDISNPDTDKLEVGQPKSDIDDTNTFRASLTVTDKTFYDRALRDFGKPYYRFTDNIREEKCLFCGEKFRTGLAMLRFCSYEHYADMTAT